MLIGWEKECSCDADFEHKNGKGKVVPCVNLDHYARRCENPPFSELLAEAIYQEEISSTVRYGDPAAISVTMLTRDPLQMWVEQRYDYVLPPLDFRWRLRGTIAHEGILARMRSPRYITEQMLMLDFGDSRLYGTMDAYDVKLHKILDLKTQSPWAIDKKAKQDPATILADDLFVQDNAAQINAYAVMARESLGLEVESGELQYWDGDLRVVEIPVPLDNHDEVYAQMRAATRGILKYMAQDTHKGIPRKEWPPKLWNPVEHSGVWHIVKELNG